MTNQPVPDARPNALHRRLTVALAAAPERSQLVELLLGDAVGDDPSPLIRSEDLWRLAGELARVRAEDRRELLSRLRAAAARTMHDRDTAASRLESLVTWQRTLREGQQWATGLVEDLDALLAAMQQARSDLDARINDHKEAVHRLERVLEQRSAAAHAIEEADRELGELAPMGMDESALRRELEAAGRAVQEAREAHDGAVRVLAEGQAEADELRRRQHELAGTMATGPDGLDPEALVAVRKALEALQGASMLNGVDRQAQALAEAWADLSADLVDHVEPTGQRPTETELRAARQRVEEASATLEALQAAPKARLSAGARVALDDAHAAVLAAEERTGRRVGAGAARQRLVEARAHEQALLDEHGFATYLDVVLSVGRTGADDSLRFAAERAHVEAVRALQSIEQVGAPSPELLYLESERERLRTHIVELLGVDPGDRTAELLRQHRTVPAELLRDLVGALSRAGVEPVGLSAGDAAVALLESQAELSAIGARQAALAVEVPAAQSEVDRTAEGLQMAERSVTAFEGELSVRAGGEMTRMQRFAAAEQLRAQVEAVHATLATAEAEAQTAVDVAAQAVTVAEGEYDRAADALADRARHARQLAEELPIDDRPEGDPLSTLTELADALGGHAAVLQPEMDSAERAFTEAAVQMDEAETAVRLVSAGADGPQVEDLTESLDELLTAAADLPVVLLEEPLVGLATEDRQLLLQVVLDRSADRQLALLTEDPEVLGWAIELPIDTAMAVPAEALLARIRRAEAPATAPRSVETTSASGAVDLSSSSIGTDPAPAPSARRWAGQR
jgi:hypothetical protein